MSRYKPINENRKETINDIYGNELGNFFLCISIKNYNAKIECCGDASCGIPAMFHQMFNMMEKTGVSDNKFLHEILDKCWEETHDN
jgi:hypothetical protein